MIISKYYRLCCACYFICNSSLLCYAELLDFSNKTYIEKSAILNRQLESSYFTTDLGNWVYSLFFKNKSNKLNNEYTNDESKKNPLALFEKTDTDKLVDESYFADSLISHDISENETKKSEHTIEHTSEASEDETGFIIPDFCQMHRAIKNRFKVTYCDQFLFYNLENDDYADEKVSTEYDAKVYSNPENPEEFMISETKQSTTPLVDEIEVVTEKLEKIEIKKIAKIEFDTSIDVESQVILKYKNSPLLRPFEYVETDLKLRLFSKLLKASKRYEFLKSFNGTLFVPVDDALEKLPVDIPELTSKQKNIHLNRNYSELLFKNEGLISDSDLIKEKVMESFEPVVLRSYTKRALSPESVITKGKVELTSDYKQRKLCVFYGTEWNDEACKVVSEEKVIESKYDVYPEDNKYFWVNGSKVLEVIACKKGFIYKLEKPIFPDFNDNEPTLIEYLKNNPEYSKLYFLVHKSKLFDDWLESLGPVTVFIIKDENWRIGPVKLPDCFFRALARPENREILVKILKWMSAPGLFYYKDLQKLQWVLNNQGPQLFVTHVNTSYWNQVQEIINKTEKLLMKSSNLEYYVELSHNKKPELQLEDLILIEGKAVIDKDIKLSNGVAHSLSSLPVRPDMDLRSLFWDCVDYICNECPITAKFLLRYFDDGGILPDPINPRSFIVPNGIRPDWVCYGNKNWFPPGWEPSDWKKYLSILSSYSNIKVTNF